MSIELDIISNSENPSLRRLSNFAPNSFTFDGVLCNSMEGLLQSFKCEDIKKQENLCALVGFTAKQVGYRFSSWKKDQILYWRGKKYDRAGLEYQALLDRVYLALSSNNDFIRALMSTGEAKLTHMIGSNKKEETVLTRDELCSRLMNIRELTFRPTLF